MLTFLSLAFRERDFLAFSPLFLPFFLFYFPAEPGFFSVLLACSVKILQNLFRNFVFDNFGKASSIFPSPCHFLAVLDPRRMSNYYRLGAYPVWFQQSFPKNFC